jgi:hypothetical protein
MAFVTNNLVRIKPNLRQRSLDAMKSRATNRQPRIQLHGITATKIKIQVGLASHYLANISFAC